LPYTIGIDARKIQDFGIGTYVRNLIRSLAAIDAENRYILLAKPGDREGLLDLPANFQVAMEKSPVYSVRELFSLSWQIYRRKLDLYHSTHYVLPAWVQSKVVVTIHDIIHLLYPEFLPSNFAFLYAQRMIRRSLTRGDRIISVSQNTRNDLMRHFDVDGRKIQVLHNGVEDSFRKRLSTEELQRWLRDLGIAQPYLLFVGNPAKPHKNLDTLVQAYARARRMAQFDAPLLCVGSREGSEFKIRQRAEYLGIGDKVRLLGHVAPEALPAIYQGATLFLYPTLYEGFGLPVIEAMASGVAVITSNTSALKEIAEGYALLVDPLDLDGMAKAIAHLMGSPERRNAFAERGQRRAEDFRWDQTARKTLDIYLSVIEGRPPEPPTRPRGDES
jgi:glycosyltransferase involved in cell wall biosynthesis